MPASLPPKFFRNAKWALRVGEYLEDQLATYLYRCEVELYMDTLLPEDAMLCTLYYTSMGEYGPEECAQNVAAAFRYIWGQDQGGQVRVEVDRFGGDPINIANPPDIVPPDSQAVRLHRGSGPPDATWIEKAGVTVESRCPREVALCLSYYAEQNIDGARGRLFLPMAYTPFTPGARPSEPPMSYALALADELANNGQGLAAWSIYSRTYGVAMRITDTWVDDEWDTQRSRGLRPTMRVEHQHAPPQLA